MLHINIYIYIICMYTYNCMYLYTVYIYTVYIYILYTPHIFIDLSIYNMLQVHVRSTGGNHSQELFGIMGQIYR